MSSSKSLESRIFVSHERRANHRAYSFGNGGTGEVREGGRVLSAYDVVVVFCCVGWRKEQRGVQEGTYLIKVYLVPSPRDRAFPKR